MSEYQITNDMQAERALRRIRAIRAERERLTNACQEQIAIYKRRLELLECDSQSRERFYTDKLNEYYGTLPAASLRRTKTGSTSYKLLGGSLRSKVPAVHYEHDDEGLAYDLEGAGLEHMVQTVRTAKWAVVKKLLHVDEETGGVFIDALDEETGEIKRHWLPSVTVAPQANRFEVQLDAIGDVDTTDDMEGADEE